MRVLLLTLLLAFTSLLHGQVDTVTIPSKVMKKSARCVVIQPSLNKGKVFDGFSVVYLLHGYSGNYSNWIMKVPALQTYADEFGVMIVCPDGDFSSWYFDSPVDSSMRYETYIAKEVPAYIDSHYPTRKSPAHRAITGLSMGGHGALFLGLRHPDVFGAYGSMSGGVDLKGLKKKYDIVKRLGDTTNFASNWVDYSVINLIDKISNPSKAIIIDCGTEDFFFADNQRLHEKMMKLKIGHDYIERPGAHNWEYWATAVPYQLLFFSRYFDSRVK